MEKNQSKEALTPPEQPSMKEFPKTVKRILTNKLLMCNIFSGVFYILSASPFISFIAKYMEVQFQTGPGGGTIIIGNFHLISIENSIKSNFHF